MKKRFSRALTTTQKIMLSFIIVILIGSILLALPISSASGEAIPYMDALFTATTATCVTGLVTVPTMSTWSIFGQIVILLLIQIGGLGVVTIVTGFAVGMQHRMGIGESILIKDAFNLNTMSGMREFVKKVIKGTFIVEAAGAVCYMPVFVSDYGPRGIWISVFNSISAFCNAGIDIFAEDSLCAYVHNPVINLVTSALIILGGIGYIVWWDVLRVWKDRKKIKCKCWKRLTLHSKITLSVTGVLVLAGAVLIFIFEYNNPLTMADYTLGQKVQASVFQSITTRTAGFASIPQQNLSNASSMVSLLLMFIGGSPVGTAGGIKTVTITILIMSAFATIKNQNDVSIFGRTISKQAVSKAVAVTSMSFIIMFASTVLLSAVTEANALDILFETVSATATVGLSRNLTGTLNIWGKVIIIVTMYLGRVGPISLATAFNSRKEIPNIIKNPTEKISVG